MSITVPAPRTDTYPQLAPGERAALVGRSGSGKTYLGRYLMLRTPLRWVVLDSKWDPGYDRYAPLKGICGARTLTRAWDGQQIVVVRPKPSENKAAILDMWLGELHDWFEGFGTLIDETYQVSVGTQPGDGLTGLVTRGRARRQTVIMGCQRPTWVPLFVFTESNFVAELSLSTDKDRKRVADSTGVPAAMEQLPPRYWLWIDIAGASATKYGPVTISTSRAKAEATK